jgi:hypothetical protein
VPGLQISFQFHLVPLHDGCLNLVDLAGSERTARSGAEGQRMKEACAINKSLSSLGDVFMSIGGAPVVQVEFT